jgi:hypothetical protein
MKKLLYIATLSASMTMLSFSIQPARADDDDGPSANRPGECGFGWFYDQKKHMCVSAM